MYIVYILYILVKPVYNSQLIYLTEAGTGLVEHLSTAKTLIPLIQC